MTRDKSIQLQSRLPYNLALKGLQRRISQGVATELEAFTSVLLCTYELRNGETKDGWIQHARGAEKLLLVRGPELCQGRLADGLVRCIKYAVVQSICVRRTPTRLATEPWLMMPFPKTRFDKLVENCLLIPSHLYDLDTLRQGPCTPSAVESLFCRAMDTKRSLEEWFRQYLQDEVSSDKDPLYQDLQYDPTNHNTDTYRPPMRIYRNSTVAEEISVLSNGLIYTLSILRDVCVPVPDVLASYNNQMVLFSEFILSTVTHADKLWGKTSGPTSLIFPLKTVAMLTPDLGQKEYAFKRLAVWDRGIGAGGVFEVPVVASGNLYKANGFHMPT